MKKLLKKSLIFLLLLVMLPLSSFLVACGAEPGESANAVSFVSDKYDETTGKAIFEVDLNVETTLEYKCNPSTAKNTARFTIPVEGQTNSSYNRSRFTFDAGVITVNYDDFEPIEVKINVNGYTDQCIVRLKEYPVEIYTIDSEVILNSYGSYTIPLMGKFKLSDGTFEERQIFEKDYNFKVVSSDETLISVPNEARLVVCSERQSFGSSKVTISINDTTNAPKGITCNVKFNIVEFVTDGFLIFEGFDKFVDNGDTLEVDANYLEANANGGYDLQFKAYFISDLNTFVEIESDVLCSSSDNEYFSFDASTKTISISSDHDIKLTVSVWTNLLKPDGSVLKLTFALDFTAEI